MARLLTLLLGATLLLAACGSTKTVTVTVGTPTPAGTNVSALVAEGAHYYNQFACAQCHGPNGLGGAPNPQSPDKSIPPLSGADFFTEFNTNQKIIDVIRSGSVIGRAPIVSMPHWGGILSNSQLNSLAEYIKTLRAS